MKKSKSATQVRKLREETDLENVKLMLHERTSTSEKVDSVSLNPRGERILFTSSKTQEFPSNISKEKYT